jgi:hypothetical protein
LCVYAIGLFWGSKMSPFNHLKNEFDVLLIYNSKDKASVRRVADALKKRGVLVWFDEDRLVPGESWVRALQEAIPNIRCAAVFVGRSGVGPWEQEEMEAFLLEFVSNGARVVPVILPGAPAEPRLPIFLGTKTWVDMRHWKKSKDGSLFRLICGIRGREPGSLRGTPGRGRRSRAGNAGATRAFAHTESRRPYALRRRRMAG